MRLLTPFIAIAFALPLSAQAQEAYAPPRTVHGYPDLHGIWTPEFLTPVERYEGMPGPAVDDATAAELASAMVAGAPEVIDPDFAFYGVDKLARVNGEWRTSLVVLPETGLLPLTEEGRKTADEYDRLFVHGFDNPEERDNFERCLSGILQAPIRPFPAPIPFQFVITADTVVIWAEDVNSLRLIHLNAPPPPNAVRSRDGWSSGRWEGDTLVVETTHLRGDDPFRPTMARAVIVSAESRVVERFTRVSADELFYEFTIEDPAIYSQPWKAEFVFDRDDGNKVYEYACHEGNYSIVNMLKAGREADRRALLATR